MVVRQALSKALQNALIVAAALAAVALPAGAVSMDEAVRLVWARMPQLEAQREQVRLAAQDRWRRFLPNEPQLLYTNADDHTNVAWGVGETFAFPGKSLAFAGLDAARWRAQEAELSAKRLELARAAAQAYLDLAAARASVEIDSRNVDDLEELSRTLRARYEAGQAAQAETIAADLQLRQAKADLAALVDRAGTAERRLAGLLGTQGPVPTAELPDDLSPALEAELVGPSPDLLRAQASAEVARASSKVSLWSQLPDLSISAQRNRYYYLPGSPSGQERTWTYGAAITVPLFFPAWEEAEARRARSQAALDEGAARLSAVAAESDADDAAREVARDRARLAQIRGQDLPLAEAMMESTLSSYKSGRLGFAELVLARKTLSDVRAQEVGLRGALVSARLRCLDRCRPKPSSQENKP